ncbi:MAG: gliding motility protein GldM [Prevotellaceae bacterium]|jgi:gliding motility-associated protein GldM|nr:gliding motility protein GldM [Prevotellaceae bacterium]
MGGATNCPETPRQKMIGMMYIVLTAMLALNVSASILEGFTMVEHSLKVSTEGVVNRNEGTMKKFGDLYVMNPSQRIATWLNKAKEVQQKSNELYNQIDTLKLKIIRTADGPEGTLDHIEAKDNLDAAGTVCLDENGGQGKVIQKAIEQYRDYMAGLVADPEKKSQIIKTFDTGDQRNDDGEMRPWRVATFEMMPLAAVTTILSKIQADVRNTEGEMITYLKSQVDAEDFRVNKVEALVIPNSKYVIKNSKYSAQIVLAASDTTQKPEVYIGGDVKSFTGGTLVPDGKYERVASAIGEQKFAGYIRIKRPDGSPQHFPFESDYNVGEPTATISADQMNVFYAGIDNEVSVSVPGVPASHVTPSITGGTLTRAAKGYIVRPAKVGQEVVITAVAKIDGKTQTMGAKSFRVKMLPPPVAFIPYTKDGSPRKYKTPADREMKKSNLLEVTKLRAELDDADIEAKFDILSFELNVTEAMGTSVEPSNGDNFTTAQMTYIKKLPRNKKFFLSGIKAKGPDGLVRNLPPMEVMIY